MSATPPNSGEREVTHAKQPVVIVLGNGFPDYRVAPFCPWCGHETHSKGMCDREVTVPCCAGVKWEPCRCAHWQHQVCPHGEFPFGLTCKICGPVILSLPLAQRILAALESYAVPGRYPTPTNLHALADELRKEMGK